MKRILSLTLMMLAMAAGAWAQDTHFQLSYQPDEDGSAGSTTVYAKLDLTPAPSVFRPYEVAAFIGDECRAVATYGTSNPANPNAGDYNYWVLDVKGNFDGSESDNNKPITFKVFNSETNAEYELTPSESITFSNTGKFGEPSDLIVLSGVEWAIEPNGDVLFCNVGDDIIDLIKLYYEILPGDVEVAAPGVVYSLGSNADPGSLSVSQTSIKALRSGLTSVRVELESIGTYCEVEVQVQNWATGGQAAPATLTVTYYDGSMDIFDAAEQIVTFTPEGYEELDLSVESSNPNLVTPIIETSDGEMVGSIYVSGTGTATLTFTVSYPDYLEELGSETTKQSSFTLTVQVNQGLLGLDVSEKLITVQKNGTFDLTTIISPNPADATIDYSKLSYEYTSTNIKIEKNILTGLQVGEQIEVAIRYADLPNYYGYLLVNVVNPAMELVVNTTEITVTMGDYQSLNDALAKAVLMDPADATDQIVWKSTDETIVKLTDRGWEPLAGGDVTMLAQVLDNSTPAPTVRLEATVTVHVIVPVENFTATYPTEMTVGQTYQIVLTPSPANAFFNLNAFNSEGTANQLPETWPFMTFGKGEKQADGTVVITMTPLEPDNGLLYVSYSDDNIFTNVIEDANISVGVPLTLDEGWQWRTLWTGISNNEFTQYFGVDGILEVRSQDALMARDSQIGYFGNLYDNGLEGNVAYKIKATRAIDIDEAKVQFDGNYEGEPLTQDLLRGWTWIPYPYYHFMTFDQLGIPGNEGDKIVSKDGGFAEYDGDAWTGTLTGLSPWQSYLYYNNSGEQGNIIWPAEQDVYTVSNDVPGGSRRKVNAQSVWQYDPRPYRDNMPIVAELEGVAMPEDYSVGAFVGDECRGEGVCVGGRMFITVHANQGEQISFRLLNNLTGE
ncbi:MAG: hypothetical protein IJV24_00950, partial [Prevotella sp.]|nr:hypothetical protein [Prevotella sp.]